MEIKTLRFSDKQTALRQIRSKFGPDAVIVDTRMVREGKGLMGMFRKKVCEVRVAYQLEDEVRLSSLRQMPSMGVSDLHEQLASRAPRADAAPRAEVAPRAARNAFRDYMPSEEASAGFLAKDVEDAGDEERRGISQAAGDVKDGVILELSNRASQKQAKPELAAKRQQRQPVRPVQKQEEQKPAVQLETAEILADAETAQAEKLSPRPVDSLEEKITRSRIMEQMREYGTGAVIQSDKAREPRKDDDPQAGLESRVEEIREMLQRFTDRMEYAKYSIEGGYSADVEKLFSKLIGAGVELDIAHELARNTQRTVDSVQANPEKTMRKNLKAILGETRFIKCERGVCHKAMLIGQTGAGKTTTLAKLAANFAVKQNYDVGIINADIFRIAAQDQLNAYADIMNIPCLTVSSAEEMNDALTQLSDCDLVLIDTTGRVASDEEYQTQVRQFIEKCAIDQVFLTLNSTTADRVLKEIIRQHAFVQDYSIIVTKTDEDVSLGNFVNICKYSGKPLAYFTTGQNVPDDIRNVDIEELIDKIMR